MSELMISLSDIQKADKILRGRVLRTPLVYSRTISSMAGARVYLKLENLQSGGSFKVRGATYRIQSHLAQARERGVVAASVGNHAQGVALASQAAGAQATIVMPLFSSISKQEATRSYGAEVVLQGRSLLESIEIATRLAEDTGRLFVHPYDDPEVIAGQGTIGLEILEDLPDVDLVLVPVGGGGLIGGIATALKALRPRTRVVGVQAEACPSASAALAAGAPVTVDATEVSSIADAIMVTRIGDLAFPLLQNLVDGMVAVDEDKISSAMLLLLERKRILAEGAGAVALAALLCRKLEVPEGGSVVLVISGGNVDSLLLDRVVHRGLLQEGRLMSISVCLEDSPGSLARLLAVLADHQANVVHIHHDRDDPRLPMGSIRVSLDLETRGLHHIKEVLWAVRRAGYSTEGRP